MKAALVACVALSVLVAGCDDNKAPQKTVASAEPANPNAPTVKALPFVIEGASISDAYKNNLKVAQIDAGVTGGTAQEWEATSIAIAEKVASFGADSVQVKIRRSEITQPQGDMFRVVVHTYYSPNPKHSVWDDGKTWQILAADTSSLATQRDVDLSAEYQTAYMKFLDAGHDDDYADAHAGAIVAKKYHLRKG